MEGYSPSASDIRAYRQAILQHGSGYDGNGYYVYNQDGEGLGQFFGSLFKSALPVITSAIKGGARIATPHLKSAARGLIETGSKRVLAKLSETHTAKGKKRRRRI